jgi:3-oxoacyl-[acyl-carrier protein] reductase
MLSGQVAAVTGGASGLGFETAATFARQGARVVVLDIDLDAATAAVGRLEPVAAGAHSALQVDVRNSTSVATAFAAIRAEAGQLDVLVNSAGVREIVDLFELSEEEWDRVIGINLTGTFNCAREAARLMIEGRRGSIINIASVVGLRGFNDRPAYAASKAGVIGLTYSLSKDLAPRGIRANVIAPGLMRTPLTEHFYADEVWASGIPDFVPQGRPGTAADIAGAALFLASDLAGFVSGIVLPVDGGFLSAGSFGKGTTVDAGKKEQD